MKKFTIRYKAGSLTGMLVIKAENKEEAEQKLWAELRNNHTKLPETNRSVRFIEDETRERFSALQLQGAKPQQK